MKYLIIFSLLLLFNCSETYESTRIHCTPQQKQKILDFVSNNIKNANNMADEEMEDVIIELRRTAYMYSCDKVVTVCTKSFGAHRCKDKYETK